MEAAQISAASAHSLVINIEQALDEVKDPPKAA
jgi:hypothetical protein